MKRNEVSPNPIKYKKLITVVSVLIPLIVALLFTVKIPNVAPFLFYPQSTLQLTVLLRLYLF